MFLIAKRIVEQPQKIALAMNAMEGKLFSKKVLQPGLYVWLGSYPLRLTIKQYHRLPATHIGQWITHCNSSLSRKNLGASQIEFHLLAW